MGVSATARRVLRVTVSTFDAGHVDDAAIGEVVGPSRA